MDGVRPSKQERQAPVITGRALLDVHCVVSVVLAIRVVPQRILHAFVSYRP